MILLVFRIIPGISIFEIFPGNVQIVVSVQFLFARDYFEFVAPSMLLQPSNSFRASGSRYAAGSRYV